jgi:sugar lactone lactonase YvrE
VWVADWTNDRIEEFNEAGEFIRQVGSEGSGDGQFAGPYGVATDPSGNVWVADTNNNRVEEFNENGGYVGKFGTQGSGAGKFSLEYPVGLATDAQADVWVTDPGNDRLEKFSEMGEYLSSFGSSGSGNGQFAHPGDLAVGPDENVWVLDSGNNRVEEFNAAGEYQLQFGSEGKRAGQLLSPDGLAVGANGDVWVLDSGNARAEEFNPEGTYLGSRSCEDIHGAVSDNYTPKPADIGSELRVTVTASDSTGEASATSSPSPVIEPVPTEPPTSVVAPSIEGEPREGQALTAGTGVWAGTEPFSFAYQWQSCNASGDECANIEGATEPKYTVGAGNVGATVRLLVRASNISGSTSSTSSATTVIVGEAPCTDTWIGPNDGSWQEVSNWSAGRIPGPSDVACVGSGVTVQLSAGDNHVGALYADGLAIGGGSLTLENTSEASHVSSLTLEKGTLGGPGSLIVDGSLTWGAEGVMSGQGTTVIDGKATATVDPSGCEPVSLAGRTLANEGTLTFGWGTLFMDEGARLENRGVFVDNSEATCYQPQIQDPLTGDAKPSILNTGTFKKTASAGSSIVGVPFSNQGIVEAQAGHLEFSGGGISTELALGSWIPRGEGAIILSAGKYWIGEHVDLNAVEVTGASVKRSLPDPSGTLTTPASEYLRGSLVVAGTASDPAGVASWELEILSGGQSSWQSACRATEASSGSAYGCNLDTRSYADGSYQIRALITDDEGDTFTTPAATRTIDNTAPQGSLAAPAQYSSATISVHGQASDVTSGVSSWELQIAPTGGSWQSACQPSTTPSEGLEFSCVLDTTPYPDGEYELRALIIDNAGNTFTTATATTTIVNTPPFNTQNPAISGSPRDGQTLIASTGTWTSLEQPSYSYQWESCNANGAECAPIEYATAPEYELGDGDIASTLRVEVTAANAAGATVATSPPSAIIETEPTEERSSPSISGTPDVHNMLYANPGAWRGTETQISYQWESCNSSGTECAPVEGATEPEYDLAEGDIATTLRVRVGTVGRTASLTDVSSPTPVIGAGGTLASTSLPSISGTPQVGVGLTASAGGWSETQGVTYAYQWQSCDRFAGDCEDIEGATGPTYTPQAGAVASTLRALVTATDEHDSATQASDATAPVAAAEAPVLETPPAIAGTALRGATLTATTGTWSGAAPITYSYQWVRCNEPTNCIAIAGATASSYTPVEGDVGSTLLVLVTATSADGNSTGLSHATAAIEPESLVNFSRPSIAGLAQPGGTLTAEPGIWSGSGHVSYAYRWESCDPAGSACAPIEGATQPSYTIAAGDLSSTLRVDVTASSPSGSQSVLSPPTVPVPGGELSVEGSEEVAQQNDPALLAPSTSVTIEEQTITPAPRDVGEQLDSQATLTTSSISKETAGEFAVNTPDGELALVPLETAPNATGIPTVVNGAAALFANTSPATDTIIRAEPLGATTLLDLRSAEAPTSFSWEVRLSPEQQLKQLPDGAVAVIQAPEAPPEAGGEQSGAEEPSGGGASSEEGQPPTSAEKAEREYEGSQPETEEEVPLESLPASPQTSTPPAEVKPGQPQPQQTQAQYEAGSSAVAAAEAQTGGATLMVIEPPTVTDATGTTVPASLRVSGGTVTMTIRPDAGTVFPASAALAVAAPTNKVSTERDPVSYGLADQQPETFAKEEHGQLVDTFDPNLQSNLKMKAARLFISYDALFEKTKTREAGEVAAGKKAMTEATRLKTWLKAVEHDKLTPYITLRKDEAIDPCNLERHACPEVSTTQYKAGVKDLIKKYGSVVKNWGAWNEPDLGEDPLRRAPGLAAQFWEIANNVISQKQMHCNGCKAVAGEFAFQRALGLMARYIGSYTSELLCHHCTRYGNGKPSMWGFHDYYDVNNHSKGALEVMVKATAGRRVGTPQLWIGEAGVKQTQEQIPFKGLTPQERETQRASAKAFLSLRSPRLARAYYYSYRQPSEGARAPARRPSFDSGLFEASYENGLYKNKGEARPAYCVLAFANEKCSPTVVTLRRGEEGINAGEAARVTPNGLSTEVYFEAGKDELGGGPPEPYNPIYTSPPNAIGSGLKPVVTTPTRGEPSCGFYHYRAVASNIEGTAEGADENEPSFCH